MSTGRSRLTSPRLQVWLGLGMVLLIALAVVVQMLGPIDPYHRAVAQTLRNELAQLPPYPGSFAAQTITQASLLTWYSDLDVSYGSTGSCDDIQGYYATQVAAAGWAAIRPLRVLEDSNPSHDELDAAYHKTTNGFSIGLTIECFVDSSFQGGYFLSLNIPPSGTQTQ